MLKHKQVTIIIDFWVVYVEEYFENLRYYASELVDQNQPCQVKENLYNISVWVIWNVKHK